MFFRLFSFSEMIYCYIASDMNAAIEMTITEMKLEKLTSNVLYIMILINNA